MAGLLQSGAQPQQGAAPQQPPQNPQQGQGQQGDPRVDMGEQSDQQREQIANAMLETLYGPMLEKVRDLLGESDQAPEDAIARVVAHLMQTVYQSITEKGSTVPPGVMVQAGMIAAQAVGEIAIRLGVIEEQDGEVIETGFMAAMAMFGQLTAETMPREQRKRYAEIIGGLRESKEASMEQQGQPPQGSPQQPSQQPQMAGGMQ